MPSPAVHELENSTLMGIQFSEDSKICSFSCAVPKCGASLHYRINRLSLGIFCCRVTACCVVPKIQRPSAMEAFISAHFTVGLGFLYELVGLAVLFSSHLKSSRSSMCSPA